MDNEDKKDFGIDQEFLPKKEPAVEPKNAEAVISQPEQTQPEQTQPEQTQPEQMQPEQAQPEQNEPVTEVFEPNPPVSEPNKMAEPPQYPQAPQYGQPAQNGYVNQNQYVYNPNNPNTGNTYGYNSQNGYVPPPMPPANPQVQTQWTFNDYGPLKGNNGQPIPPQKPKKDKKEKPKNFGLKVFAVIMSVLFVGAVAGFSIYMVWGDGNSPITGNTSSGSNAGGAPNLDISNTPDKPSGDQNGDGTLSTKEIYNKVSPAVVGVAVYIKQYGEVKQGEGSGVIMDKDGYIITNYHVVASDPEYPVVKIEIIMPNGDTHIASMVGGDSKTDLAVLKIDVPDLVPAEFGDSDKLSIGDRVVVIGNPSGVQFAGSLTQGVVSALNRNVYLSELQAQMQYIQTDAAINPGNSGGAFINEYGQVVGISSAKMRVEAGYEGMGFAIPINSAKSVVDSLIKNGYVAGRPRIGIQYKAVSKTLAELNGIPAGLRVVVVEEGFDAYDKGVRAGDIITKMDGAEVYDTETTSNVMKNKKAGDEMLLSIYRVNESGKSTTLEMTVILGEDTTQKPVE